MSRRYVTPFVNARNETVRCDHEDFARRNFTARPITVLRYAHLSGKQRACDLPCRFTSDEGLLLEADALLRVVPWDMELPRRQWCRHQKRVMTSMESPVFHPEILQGPTHYHIWGSTDLDSDVPVPYFSWSEYRFDAPVQEKNASAHAVAFISNCADRNGRLEYLGRLMRAGLRVDSFGACMQNHEPPPGAGRGGTVPSFFFFFADPYRPQE
jgi:hypothetical protein